MKGEFVGWSLLFISFGAFILIFSISYGILPLDPNAHRASSSAL
jgi:hypothetical protein